MIIEGCHKNFDCKIGGGETVNYCYGPSCYEYKNLPFRLKEVVARHKRRETYKRGINKTCIYKHPFRAICRVGLFRLKVIWHG